MIEKHKNGRAFLNCTFRINSYKNKKINDKKGEENEQKISYPIACIYAAA